MIGMLNLLMARPLPRAFAIGSAVLLTAILLAGVAPARAGDWKGKEVVEDGTLYVKNPAEPMEKPKSVGPKELWRIGGETDDEDEFFGVISQVLTDDGGNVYLLDSQLNSVKIFGSDGGFIREIGREGEGPGEFRGPSGMFFTADGNVAVMQTMPGKIVLLSRDGEPVGEFALPTPEAGGFFLLINGRSFGKNVILQGAVASMAEGRWQQERYLASVSPDGKELARYCSDVRTIDFANPVMSDTEWDTFDRRWGMSKDGRVYAATDYEDYRIRVWNADGTADRVIERPFTHRKRSDSEKKVMEDLMGLFARQIPNCTVKITEWTKDVENVFVMDDGSLWVLNANGSRDYPEGSLGVFDVFDPKGRFVREVTVTGEGDPQLDGYYFVGDRLYVVTDLLQAAISLQAGGQSFQVGEEEPEPMAVICYQFDGGVLTSKR